MNLANSLLLGFWYTPTIHGQSLPIRILLPRFLSSNKGFLLFLCPHVTIDSRFRFWISFVVVNVDVEEDVDEADVVEEDVDDEDDREDVEDVVEDEPVVEEDVWDGLVDEGVVVDDVVEEDVVVLLELVEDDVDEDVVVVDEDFIRLLVKYVALPNWICWTTREKHASFCGIIEITNVNKHKREHERKYIMRKIYFYKIL